MKHTFTLMMAGSLFLALSCNRPETENTLKAGDPSVLKTKSHPAALPAGNPLSKTKLDQYVIQTLEAEHDFRWTEQDLPTLWSALQEEQGTLAIGYKPAGTGSIDNYIHQIDLSKGAWKSTHDALIAFIKERVKLHTGQEADWNAMLVEDDPVLPIITIKLKDKAVLTDLYNLENVRYLEPLDYWPATVERSSSGCDPSGTALNAADYTSISPAAIQPWNYVNTNIPAAWNVAQGQGITIGVIDAGISASQTLLGSQFASGLSTGRSITTDYTLGSSAYTSCSHGTSMCGLAAGPRTSLNAPTGVAYRSNLHFIRACNDVVLDGSSERTGVKNALVKMGDRASVKIVSMSIGTPFYSSVLLDGVNYCYNKGKLIFAAAGTSFSWTSWWGVIYPAAYANCLAVTGVNESSSTCDVCHDGGEVMYTVVMERNSNVDRNSLSLSPSGSTPSYIGGSSCATATAAGVAALVWSVNPNLSRAQVQNAITTTSQYYPNKNSARGYGNINAGAAVAAAQNL